MFNAGIVIDLRCNCSPKVTWLTLMDNIPRLIQNALKTILSLAWINEYKITAKSSWFHISWISARALLKAPTAYNFSDWVKARLDRTSMRCKRSVYSYAS